jgi:hypothetical protein
MQIASIHYRTLGIVFIFCLALLSACGGNTAPAADAGDLQIQIVAPAEGIMADTLVIHLRDAAGQPITDATVALEGNMNHAGMAPVFADAVTDEADGAADGYYTVPFAFTMLGDWILTVTVEEADGATVTRDLDLTVAEDAVTGDAVEPARE